MARCKKVYAAHLPTPYPTRTAIFYNLQMQNGIVILHNSPEIRNATDPQPFG